MSIKSELDKTASYLRRARQSIIGRGGEISLNAGLKDLPQAIFNIPADNSLSYYTDEEIAYQKIVPEGAEEYALLKKVGGMTYKCNNLIPYPYSQTTHTNKGITFTDNGDGTIMVNGTATGGNIFFDVCGDLSTGIPWMECNLPAGSYFLSGCPKGGSKSTYRLSFALKDEEGTKSFDSSDIGEGLNITISKTATQMFCRAVIYDGMTVNNLTFKPMLNVGTTALPYEPFFEGLRDTKVTEIVSKGENLELISYPIPEAVQALDGYGWGINADCYNYIDYEKKQFVKRVERVDMGTLGWWETSGVVSRFGSPLKKLAKPTGSYNVAVNAICSAYPNITQNFLFANNTGVSIQALTANNVYVYDANYTDTPSFKSAMSGVMLYYELIITDISDILTGDNFIEVESGGTLEFVNEYKNAVPSTIKYIVKAGI
mgnify:FL=1